MRFLMIGGFLGAGKTTAIGRLARIWTDAGKRVGLVTNDQAYDLVDTKSLQAQGFDVGEVPGACFCCKFDDLAETMAKLGESAPDVIIAEPVGSCTDLAATVIEPMRSLYGDRYELGPLTVLLKPEHGRRILLDKGNMGFSPKAAYIFRKQLEEADIVVVHKADKLPAEETEALLALIRSQYPEKQVLAASAKTGLGFDSLMASLEQTAPQRTRFMELDYEIYAEGEAELGWLNCQARLQGASPFAIDAFLTGCLQLLRDRLLAESFEPAHLKILAEADGQTAIANLVGSDCDVELSLPSDAASPRADLVVNARVAGEPERLEELVRETLAQAATEFGLEWEVHGMQRFRPAPPTPTHRYQ